MIKHRVLFSFISGLIASFALPPHGFVLGLLALSWPAMQIIHVKSMGHGFLIGCATGFGWFVYSLFWISHAFIVSGGGHEVLIPFSAIGLPLFLSLFWGIAFAISSMPRARLSRLLLLPALLSLAEYTRGHILTGFPWNAPGMVLAHSEITLGIVSYIGLWAGSVLILCVGILPALVLQNARVISSVISFVIIGLFALGADHIHRNNPDDGEHYIVRLIQPNIDQNDKWDAGKRRDHLTEMMTMSRQPTAALSKDKDVDLIVWPETGFAGFYDRERGLFNAIVQAASAGKTPIVTGTLSSPKNGDFFNSAVVYDPQSGVSAPYHKRHLVPFGEYAPLRDYIPYIDVIAGPADFLPGQEIKPLEISMQNGQEIITLPLICYEIIFPNKVRQDVNTTDPDVIINLTNDAWFGDTIGPRQHLAMAQLRAAELGIPVIRVANTGISAMIDAHGNVTHSLDYGYKGIIDVNLGGQVKTYYSTLGEFVFGLMLMMIFFIGLTMPLLTRDHD